MSVTQISFNSPTTHLMQDDSSEPKADTRSYFSPRVTESTLKIKQVKNAATQHFLSPQCLATSRLGEEQCGNCAEKSLQKQIPKVHQKK